PIELGGLEPAPEDGDAVGVGQVQQLLWDLLPLGYENAGQIESEEVLESLLPFLRRQRAEVGDLGLTQHVQAVGREPAGVAGEREPGAGDFGIGQLTVEAQLAGERLELERVATTGKEIAEPQHQVVRGGGVRARRGRPFALSSCRRNLSSARSRAVR